MSQQPDRFETGAAMHLAGLDMSYTFKTMNDIPEQWDRIAPHLGTTPNQVGRVAYGVCHDFRQDGFAYFTGVQVSNTSALPKNLTTLDLPAQKYAVFKHEGPIAAIREVIDRAWTWAKSSGQGRTDNPLHVEVYGETWRPDKDGGLEIWVPVK
jgi:AraC family transcriptional regulator